MKLYNLELITRPTIKYSIANLKDNENYLNEINCDVNWEYILKVISKNYTMYEVDEKLIKLMLVIGIKCVILEYLYSLSDLELLEKILTQKSFKDFLGIQSDDEVIYKNIVFKYKNFINEDQKQSIIKLFYSQLNENH